MTGWGAFAIIRRGELLGGCCVMTSANLDKKNDVYIVYTFYYYIFLKSYLLLFKLLNESSYEHFILKVKFLY